MFKRKRDGSVIDKHFVLLSYPPYWHYNILFGLKVMAEAGFIIRPSLQISPRPARIQMPARWRLSGRRIVLAPD